jgi:hypothetical protein
MNDTTETVKRYERSKGRNRKHRFAELDECQYWLESLGLLSTPKIHINGTAHPTAVVVVDFGTPLAEAVKLSSDQAAELINHIRNQTRALYREREVNIRVQNDNASGVWWSSVG